MIPTGSSHYKTGPVEPLELIESQHLCFHIGNVVKYAVRAQYYADVIDPSMTWGRSHEELSIEAIDKAIWYLNRYKEITWPQHQSTPSP